MDGWPLTDISCSKAVTCVALRVLKLPARLLIHAFDAGVVWCGLNGCCKSLPPRANRNILDVREAHVLFVLQSRPCCRRHEVVSIQ